MITLCPINRQKKVISQKKNDAIKTEVIFDTHFVMIQGLKFKIQLHKNIFLIKYLSKT